MGIGIQKEFLWFTDGVLVWDDWGITPGMKAALQYLENAVGSGVLVSFHSKGEVPEWDHLAEIELP
jgi:hypothetical protein